MRAATSVGEVPAATFSGGYLPRGGEQVATVVLCCKALRALGEVKWFSAHQALAESFPGGSTQPTGAWTTHHLPNAVSTKMPEASTCVWAPIHLRLLNPQRTGSDFLAARERGDEEGRTPASGAGAHPPDEKSLRQNSFVKWTRSQTSPNHKSDLPTVVVVSKVVATEFYFPT